MGVMSRAGQTSIVAAGSGVSAGGVMLLGVDDFVDDLLDFLHYEVLLVVGEVC
jgi:chloramphenicol 3-O-phosphotransferase